MHNIISHHDWCPACPWAVIGSFQVTPPVYTLGMMSYVMEYPFGQFGSALLPSFLCSSLLAEHKELKSPWFKVITA